MTETIEPMVKLDEVERHQFAQQPVDQARSEGVDLIGPFGLLTGLTKTVLETALEEEISGQARSSRRSSASGNDAWTGSTSSCCRSRRGA